MERLNDSCVSCQALCNRLRLGAGDYQLQRVPMSLYATLQASDARHSATACALARFATSTAACSDRALRTRRTCAEGSAGTCCCMPRCAGCAAAASCALSTRLAASCSAVGATACELQGVLRQQMLQMLMVQDASS